MFKLSAVAVLVAVSACSYADGVDINDLQVRQDQIVQVVTAHDARLTGLETAVSTPGPKGDTGAAGKDGAPGSVSKKQIIQMNKNTSAVNQLYAQTDELIDAHNENVAAIDSNTQRIDSVENHDKQQDKEIQHNNKKAMAGIASALAQTGLHYTDSDNSLAAGVGNYSGESALSVGYSHQWGDRIRISLQGSTDSSHNIGSSASMAVGW